MDPIIGIDLGTTNSAAALLTPDGPQLIPNALGGRLTPSVVGVDEAGTVLVGAAAREQQVVRPGRCAALFKRDMGTDRTHTLGGRSFSPEELSGLVLRSLKADAEAMLGRPVTRAVITCPAYFNDRQRKATLAAGRIAGLTVERVLNEPTAAAIAYGFHEAGRDRKLLVFDLGGGTFDVSVVELFEGTLEVRASAGETSLGGEDFTRTLAARVLERLGESFERAEAKTPLLVSRLVQQCEQAKCRLSREETATVRVPDATGDVGAGAREVTVTRAELEAWVGPTLARVELPIRRALGDAKLSREGIDEVILVRVYQGEARRVGENLLLGEFEVGGIPPGPPGQEVDVRFTYDLNGVLEVEATVVATRRKVTHVIARHAKGLTEEQVRRAVREMEKLKAHPREEAANRFLLARAERVFKELPAELRRVLADLLDGFEAGLESRDPEAIARHREVLTRFLSLHDPFGDDPTGNAE